MTDLSEPVGRVETKVGTCVPAKICSLLESVIPTITPVWPPFPIVLKALPYCKNVSFNSLTCHALSDNSYTVKYVVS